MEMGVYWGKQDGTWEIGKARGTWEKRGKIVFLSQVRFQGAGGYFIPGPYKCHHANLDKDAQNGEVTGIWADDAALGVEGVAGA